MNDALSITLSAAIPLQIQRLAAKGGPTDSDRERARAFAAVLAENGDVLMYGGKKGETAKLFNELAFAMAVLAFQPGGIKLFGHRWVYESSRIKNRHLEVWNCE